ncbi:tumor protein p53-inducible nuclear protein 2 isoform X3 [Enoplosus armatus]|uniref:tumor protein p53-inducible nuclear protein 2 isoform X3 n=1 Tax=Enoplosus armatus TaxID=215367 RepID=UPI0039915815
MFQRLSNLLFGEVEEVAAELKGPNPCVTEADEEGWMLVNLPEGATAEASPMEDLLIEHPSMSVYVSSNNLSMVSNSNLSVVGEESIVSLASSVSRVAEPAAAPATRSTMPTRVTQAGALAKVTQVARVQRSKARIERRHLGRNRIQRQNRTREQVPRHAAHARNTFLHQPSKRNICH